MLRVSVPSSSYPRPPARASPSAPSVVSVMSAFESQFRAAVCSARSQSVAPIGTGARASHGRRRSEEIVGLRQGRETSSRARIISVRDASVSSRTPKAIVTSQQIGHGSGVGHRRPERPERAIRLVADDERMILAELRPRSRASPRARCAPSGWSDRSREASHRTPFAVASFVLLNIPAASACL